MLSAHRELLDASTRGLRAALEGGHPIPDGALDDMEYRGISLGLPGLVDRLLWKTFAKTFHRDPSGRLRGWNVRLEQTGIDGEHIHQTKGGESVTFGHYEVLPAQDYRMPVAARHGLMLDYGRGGNGRLDPTRQVRDPLVALEPGSVDVLLGCTYVDLGLARMRTPSYFLLLRQGPLAHLATPPRPLS